MTPNAAARLACGLAVVSGLVLAALWMRSIAVSAALHAQAFDALGAGSKALVLGLLGLLVLLGCRHLVMLGLAAWDHATPAPRPQAPAGRLPFVSIIVPAFNEAGMIAAVLESLLRVRYPRFEVIVVDDGSSDQTFLQALPFRRRRGVQYRVLAKANGGKFDALNHGIAHARGEIVICIDGDSLLHPDAVRHCVAHFDDPRVGAVAGNVRVANRGRSLWSMLQGLEYMVGYGLAKRAQSAARVVTIVPGPLGAFRKRALSQAAGYDGDSFAEDFDLTMKLLGAGWHVAYEPRAVVYTEAPERALELLRQRYRWTRGSLQVLRKRARWLGRPLAAPLRFAGAWYVALECLALPALHVGAQLLFVAGGLWLGVHLLVVCWWLQLVLLECAVVAFCAAVEDDSPWLVLAAPLYRSFYMLVLDVARLLATLEELKGAAMGWDKIARLGRLAQARC